MPIILLDKWKEIADRALICGQGDLNKGLCVMQAVDYISSGGTSDHPECACPVLTRVAIHINDRFNDENRQKLKPLILSLVGTKADDATQIARKRFIMWRNVTVIYPFLLDLLGAKEHSEKIRAFKNTLEDMAAAAKYINENREAIRKIADAYAYADADAYAYANADANAYAYAKKISLEEAKKRFRADLADLAVETLRLAIEVKAVVSNE